MISKEELHKILSYNPDEGVLTWKKRDVSQFTDFKRRTAIHACKNWNSRCAGKTAFTSLTPTGYVQGTIFGKRRLGHQVVWMMVHGSLPKPPYCLDHINGNRSDNRISNLRKVLISENNRNTGIRTSNTSGVCGVSWYKSSRKWVAEIAYNGEKIRLGRFDKLEDAAAARKAAEVKYGFHENHGKTHRGYYKNNP